MNAQAKRETVGDVLDQLDQRRAAIIEDVTAISQAARYLEVAPVNLFDASLVSELADSSDRLAAKVARLQEWQGAGR